MPDPQVHASGDGPSDASIRALVATAFEATAVDQQRDLQPLSDELLLLESGLDSLCFAIIVAQLEDELGVDPFSEMDDAFFPTTFGEFVRLYQAAAPDQAAA